MSGRAAAYCATNAQASADLPVRFAGKVGAFVIGRLENGYFAAARAAS
jgi:hypothetical protein